ncbi:MAG: hypothetical protein ACJ785_07640 [Gemmatimonadaceae bacterium]
MKIAVASALLLCGCYSYRNTGIADAAIMAPVRVELTEAGAQELSSQVGPRGTALEGVITVKSESTLVFGVTGLTRTNGVEETWHGERVTVPTSSVSRIQLRRFSPLNTALFIGGLVAGGLLVKTISGAGDVFGGTGGPPTTGQ